MVSRKKLEIPSIKISTGGRGEGGGEKDGGRIKVKWDAEKLEGKDWRMRKEEKEEQEKRKISSKLDFSKLDNYNH